MINILNELLESETESEVLEFKEAKKGFDKDKLGKYFSALSNEANLKSKSNAWLLFGVKDNQTLLGTSISDKKLNEFKLEISKGTSPSLSFVEIHKVVKDEKVVLMFEIPAAPLGMPVAWKGHYYGRDGESLGALNIQELERIRMQNKMYDWSAEIVDNATISDLSQEAIKEARVQFTRKNKNLENVISNWDDITFLNKSKLTIKGKITNTAILLLGKQESSHFINPATSKITWILRDKDNLEKDYAHFSCPLLLDVDEVYKKIRNLKYRYLQEETLFPDEVDQYDSFVIREALNNCIAHQDYSLGGKINLVEREDGELTFINMGDFIPHSIEQVIISDAPEPKYRNPFLAEAMVNLNMIDTMGSGIKRMFIIQKNKYFPLPDYELSNQKVKVKIFGKIIDMNYAKKLAEFEDLTLEEIILLDKVAKNKELATDEVKQLKIKKLIEGRKPNYYISSTIANAVGEKEKYIKLRGFKDVHYKKMVLEYIGTYKSASKPDIDSLLLDILPDILDKQQKENKVKNIIYSMSKKDKSIVNQGTNRKPVWVQSLSKKGLYKNN